MTVFLILQKIDRVLLIAFFSLFGVVSAGFIVQYVLAATSYASDSFERSEQDSWGTADIGGSWKLKGGSSADYQVNGSSASHAVTDSGTTRTSLLPISRLDMDVTYKFKIDKVPSERNLYQLAMLRASDVKNYYASIIKLQNDQTVKVGFEKRVAGSGSLVGSYTDVPQVIYLAEVWYQVRVQAEGVNPTALRMKIWQDGEQEPASWDYEIDDSEPGLQSEGGIGIRSKRHSKTIDAPFQFTYDDIQASSLFEVIPDPDSPAVTHVIHVDPINGDDRNIGSTASPYQSIQKALQESQPGWTVKLGSGIYQESIETVSAGTSTDPIIIEPEEDAIPIVDGASNSLHAIRITHSFYTLRDFEMRNADQGIRLEGVEGVVIENMHIHHINNECVRLRYFSKQNTIRNNIIHDCGLSGNGEGIYVGTVPDQRYKNGSLPDESTANTISGNEIYAVDEGIDVKEDSSFNTIANNIVRQTTSTGSAGINIQSDDNSIQGNISFDNQGSGFRFGGSIAPSPVYGEDYQYGVNNILRNNTASSNAMYGFKFITGPQDADCTNGGSNNERGLSYFGPEVEEFLVCTPPAE